MASYTIHITAYERKPALWVGKPQERFAGLVTVPTGSLALRGRGDRRKELFGTYEEARNWAIAEAHRLMDGRPYRRSSVNRKSAGHKYEAFIYA